MYYQDLTPFEYWTGLVTPNLFNVGWLDSFHPYPKGEVSEEFKERLFQFCRSPVNRTRGWQECQFCGQRHRVKVIRNETTLVLGSAGIRVSGEGGVIYAAPDMVYHYVTEHNYKPPD